ncbi:hypothetical protein TNCV_4804471 [Trichonephila clavipes]|nr:hypothetical protein TNCV_4804471 [Trichonephila clavipes]
MGTVDLKVIVRALNDIRSPWHCHSHIPREIPDDLNFLLENVGKTTVQSRCTGAMIKQLTFLESMIPADDQWSPA